MENNTFFFIPDISGFTKFINETEISHSRHIIQELLELLVNSNSIGLQVSEFEGDAIFFYRSGAPPNVSELAEQARKMFINFHSHLRKYDTHRLCQCGACKSAHQLTLKFIAHYGEANSYTVKNHSKLIGKDVILVHRLLKNSINQSEYLLLSDILLNNNGSNSTYSWFKLETGADSYDEIGKVRYSYTSLTPLLDEVKEADPPEDFVLKDSVKLVEVEDIIKAPMEDIYSVMIDISMRPVWNTNIMEVIRRDKMPNQVGTYHRCVTNERDLNLITSNVLITDSTMEFWETDTKRTFSSRYYLERTGEETTKCMCQFFIRNSLPIKIMFKLLMKNKIRKNVLNGLNDLKTYCEKNMGVIK